MRLCWFHRITLFLLVQSLWVAHGWIAVSTQPGHHRSIPSLYSSRKGDMEDTTTTTTSSLSNENKRSPVDDADRSSTLLLLEHVNLNVPSHDDAVPFYFGVLACGVDPRRAHNLRAGNGTVWANCGASQFHLPYGVVAQRIPGRMGLRWSRPDAWAALQQRISAASKPSCVRSVVHGTDRYGQASIELTDVHGNVFFCRAEEPPARRMRRRVDQIRQPVVEEEEDFASIAALRGGTGGCSGLEFVEFFCPPGSAEKIALFYDSVLDAPVRVIEDDGSKVAIIAVGAIDADSGRADQSILFRESSDPLPPYDGHHIALYVGDTWADFEQAYRNCELAGLVWVNPRFSDRADSLAGAREWKQFRFKNIIDMETGETILELEHEMRSIEHEAWIGTSS